MAALSSIYIHEMDDQLVEHISECLFTIPQQSDSWIQVAALDAAVLLSIKYAPKYKRINPNLTQHPLSFVIAYW